MLALLRNPGSLTPETPEIVELGPADPTPANHVHTLYGRCVEGEDSLDTDSGRDLPNREGLTDATTTPTDADPLKGLDPLFLTLTDAV